MRVDIWALFVFAVVWGKGRDGIDFCFSIAKANGRYQIPFRKGNGNVNIHLWVMQAFPGRILQTSGSRILRAFRMKADPRTPFQPAL